MARRPSTVQVLYHQGAEDDFARGSEMRDFIQEVGDKIAVVATIIAPVGSPVSHGGALSIHAEMRLTPKGWRAHIGWDKAHFYLKFQELGTIYQDAQPFLRPALEAARI